MNPFIINVSSFFCEKNIYKNFYSRVQFHLDNCVFLEKITYYLRTWLFSLFFALCTFYFDTLCMNYLKSDLRIFKNLTMLYSLWQVTNNISLWQVAGSKLLLLLLLIKSILLELQFDTSKYFQNLKFWFYVLLLKGNNSHFSEIWLPDWWKKVIFAHSNLDAFRLCTCISGFNLRYCVSKCRTFYFIVIFLLIATGRVSIFFLTNCCHYVCWKSFFLVLVTAIRLYVNC